MEVEPLKKRWRRLVFSFNASLRRRSIGIITELSRTHGGEEGMVSDGGRKGRREKWREGEKD